MNDDENKKKIREKIRTWSLGRTASSWAGVSCLKAGPSRAMPPSVRMPHSLAMALAVSRLSPTDSTQILVSGKVIDL